MTNENIQPLLDWPTFIGILILVSVLICGAIALHERKGK